MNILLTNDDGYQALGINVLAKKLATKHNVYVVAPAGERSGSSHAVSFFSSYSFKMIESDQPYQTYVVDGTPADCVVFGILHILKDVKIDIVISGINNVMNVGSDHIYSGTVGAAQEGAYLGYRALAVSLREKKTGNYEFASDFVFDNLDRFFVGIDNTGDNKIAINLNIPCTNKADVKGIEICPVGFRPYDENFVSKIDDDGREVFYVCGKPRKYNNPDIWNDVAKTEQGFVTITPIKLYASDMDAIKKLEQVDFRL